MKNRQLVLIIFILLLPYFLNAQISYGGKPASLRLSLQEDIDHVVLRAPDMETIRQEDLLDEKNGTVQKIGRIIHEQLNMENSGTWDELDDGRHVWRLQISSKDALALSLTFQEFYLPNGSELFIYSPDKLQIIGAFNEKTNSNGGRFATELIYGSSLMIEYISPMQRAIDHRIRQFENTATIEIDGVNYVYRHVKDYYRDKGFGDAGDCEVNINCIEGAEWQDEKRGIARVLLYGYGFSGWCSASLVNNTSEDGTPYLLSAWHCREGVSDDYLDQWVFYFNYEFSECETELFQPSGNTITGAELVAEGQLNGGSDFLLLELSNNLPPSYNVVFNGWSRLNSAGNRGACIHHPYGDVKKISTYNTNLTSATYYGVGSEVGATSAHWKTYWAETQNGHGVTEGGSSGSPLFNSSGLIIGTLTGGSSSCSNTDLSDLFGKFFYHWTSNGSQLINQLKPWLDPESTNVLELGFFDPNSAGVQASFAANPTVIQINQTVQFVSTSNGNIDEYLWTFQGGEPSSSDLPNPVVRYDNTGFFDVTLRVSNADGLDELTKTDFIKVNPQGIGEECNFLNYPLSGTHTFYTTDGGSGFVSGTNSYGDLTKVNYFESTGRKYVTKMGFYLAYAQGTQSSIKLVVYNDNDGTPGELIGSKTISMQDVISDFESEGDYFEYYFDYPIEVNEDFYAGIELPGGSDIIALITNSDGDVFPGTAWEQWADLSWHKYSDEDAWDIHVNNAIFIESCSTLDVEENKLKTSIIYPNPANSHIVIEFLDNFADEYVNFKIFNLSGKCVKTELATFSQKLIIDVSGFDKGLYLIQLQTDSSIYNHRFEIVR
jgi:PKD repeat protein